MKLLPPNVLRGQSLAAAFIVGLVGETGTRIEEIGVYLMM